MFIELAIAEVDFVIVFLCYLIRPIQNVCPVKGNRCWYQKVIYENILVNYL